MKSNYGENYQIIGEATGIYVHERNPKYPEDYDYSLIDLIDDAEGKPKVTVYYPGILEQEKIFGRRIAVSGKARMYNGQVQIKATKVDILPEASKRVQTLLDWADKYKSLNLTKSTKYDFKTPFRKLHVISAKTGAGYGDFVGIINYLQKDEW